MNLAWLKNPKSFSHDKAYFIGKYFVLFQSDLNIVASYDRKGKYIFTGNAKGRVCTSS